MHRYFEQQVFDDLDRGFREPVPRPEPSSHQSAAVDMQAASSSWWKWASTGWLATCLCIALVFGWRAAGHSGSLAQPVHAASPSTPAISPADPAAGSLPLVPIESVTTAHEVLAFDPATGRTAWKPVLQSFRRTADHLRHLTVLSPGGTTQTFETTDEHPFWSVDAGEWVAAGSLAVGDRFQATDGSLHVLTATRHEPHPDGMPVFNFEVDDYHSYFVSAHGTRGPPLLVHNADCADPAADSQPTRLSWNEFRSRVGGHGYSQKQISRLYRKYLNSKGIDPTGQSRRLQYLGATPGKNSATGRAVIERIRAEGRVLDRATGTFVRDADGTWYPLAEMDMGQYPVDAVRFWNSTGIQHRPKSPVARQWMLDSINCELQHFSRNRALGTQLGETYIDP